MKKKRYVLGIGYPWGFNLVNSGFDCLAIKLKTKANGYGDDLTLKHLGKWGAWGKYKLILEQESKRPEGKI